MNTNEHLDFYNPDSIYYANSHHYIQQLEAKVRQQQAEIEALNRFIAERGETGQLIIWKAQEK